MDSRKVLDYGDVLLRQSDVDLLKGPHWLNDQIVAFCFEFLTRERLAGKDDVLLVPGSISYLLANSGPTEAGLVSEPLQLPRRRLVLFAVNDNPYVDLPGGGSHWTLLAYSAAAKAFWHFDSAAGSSAASSPNAAAAGRIAQATGPFLSGADEGSGIRISEAKAPQQSNGYDCGLHMLAAATSIIQQQEAAKAAGLDGIDRVPEAALADAVTSASVQQLRQDMLSLIQENAGQAC